MIVFFDTEFTGLVPRTSLLSIGLVSEDNKEFYAEFNDYDESLITPWIEENVIKHMLLPWANEDEADYYQASRSDDNPTDSSLYNGYSVHLRGCDAAIGFELERWFSQFDKVQLVSDVCHYDMYLLCNQLFDGAFDLPSHVNPVCYDICQDLTMLDRSTFREIFDPTANVDRMRWAFDVSREKLCQELNSCLPEGAKHNALYDAKVIKMIYERIHI